MKEEFISRWMEQPGPKSDVVVSSRIRLARNLARINFTNHASDEELQRVIDKVNNLIINDNKFDLDLINLGDLSTVEGKMLVEKHLISPEHSQSDNNRAVALSKDETISLMINEEDHLRLQLLLPGLQLEKAWDLADGIDDYLEDDIDIAFDEKYGYLTACPTNVGTGLRASVMVHLPALSMVNRVKKLMAAISQLGLAVRGLYGEGTDAIGNLYQISNQVTLGQSEDEVIENLLEVTHQIIEQERNARKILLQEKETVLKDKVYRSYGTLKYVYSISVEEAMQLISNVRLGIDLDIIDDVEPVILNQLMVIIRPATLQIIKEDELAIDERNTYRAQLIRERLN